MSELINKSTIKFLKDLRRNNNREWFAEHKPKYVKAHENIKSVMSELERLLNKHDVIEDHKTYRIYRDVRFSKDKTPYKSGIGTGFTRATAARRGGCYVHIEPGASFVGGGFWSPEKDDLKRIRQEIAIDAEPLRKILRAKKFKDNFGTLNGEQLKTAPRGIDKNHPNVDLLRYKQFLLYKSFTDQEVAAVDFPKRCSDAFKAMRPFFDYMSMILTTDENGESILQ